MAVEFVWQDPGREVATGRIIAGPPVPRPEGRRPGTGGPYPLLMALEDRGKGGAVHRWIARYRPVPEGLGADTAVPSNERWFSGHAYAITAAEAVWPVRTEQADSWSAMVFLTR